MERNNNTIGNNEAPGGPGVDTFSRRLLYELGTFKYALRHAAGIRTSEIFLYEYSVAPPRMRATVMDLQGCVGN